MKPSKLKPKPNFQSRETDLYVTGTGTGRARTRNRNWNRLELCFFGINEDYGLALTDSEPTKLTEMKIGTEN